MGVPPKKSFVCYGQSHRSKWMMTGGTPISGNKPTSLLVRFTQGCWMGTGVAGIVINSYDGLFPHSQLRSTKHQ